MKIITATLLISMLTYIGYDQAILKTEKSNTEKWKPHGKYGMNMRWFGEIDFTNEKYDKPINIEELLAPPKSNSPWWVDSMTYKERDYFYSQPSDDPKIMKQQKIRWKKEEQRKKAFERKQRQLADELRKELHMELDKAQKQNRLYIASFNENIPNNGFMKRKSPENLNKGMWFVNDKDEIMVYQKYSYLDIPEGWCPTGAPLSVSWKHRRFIRHEEGLIEISRNTTPWLKFE